jgi:hypothetical protein
MADLPLRAPSGRVAFGRIEPLGIEGATLPEETLEKALVAGTRIERIRRVWHMGQHHREGPSIVGRIGYESSSVTELWDDETLDFTADTLRAGLTSPFAIDPKTLRIAFQLRGRDIRPKSFTGALQALLNEASPTERWRVHREFLDVEFTAWVSQVDRIVALRMVVERPNPHYAGRDRVRAIVEGTNARLADLQLRADEDDLQGIDVTDGLVQEMIEHAAANYGHYSAVAEQAGEQTAWNSTQAGATEVHRVAVNPETKEVTGVTLRHELGDLTAEQDAIEEARAAMLAEHEAEAEDPAELLEDLEPDE